MSLCRRLSFEFPKEKSQQFLLSRIRNANSHTIIQNLFLDKHFIQTVDWQCVWAENEICEDEDFRQAKWEA